MSYIQTQSLSQATAIISGEAPPLNPVGSFSLQNLGIWRFKGIETAPGHESADVDEAWRIFLYALYRYGGNWGLFLRSNEEGILWDLGFPNQVSNIPSIIQGQIAGAIVDPADTFPDFSQLLQKYPFRASLAGHPGAGQTARLDSVLHGTQGRRFILMVLAKPVSMQEIYEETQRLESEEQFVRDEHLARPGLEDDNHAVASRYVELLKASIERSTLALQEGGWLVRTLLATESQQDLREVSALVQSAYSSDGGKPEPLRWQEVSDPRAPTFLRSGELAALTRPPRDEFPGFTFEGSTGSASNGNSSPGGFSFSTVPPSHGSVSVIALGRVLNRSNQPGSWLELPIKDLCRHLLIAGMPGSGKSVSTLQILLELWREHRIPWLVIEAGMKTGYRSLLSSEIGADIQGWSIGVPDAQRLPLNPLSAPVGTALAEHTSALFAVIASAFELVAPMPEVLATAIEETYRRHGWSLDGRVPSEAPPCLEDLVREVERCASSTGHSGEVSANIRAGLTLRLKRLARGPLAPELGARHGLDMGVLLSSPAIIELAALPDAASQALVMGLIALQLRHHWRLAGESATLRHVTVIEEAHRLLRKVSDNAANSARLQATEDLANMLAELRGFGAGMIIVDQTPSALVPAVIANTGTKLLHRLDHGEDRESAGRAAGLPADRVDLLGTMQIGEAVLRTDRRPRPFRLRMPNPALAYAGKPVPELTARNQIEKIFPCPVCGEKACSARAEGDNPEKLTSRLSKLRPLLGEGGEEIWDFALKEISQVAPASPKAPLCFLVALARAARLPREIIRAIQENFLPNTQHPEK